MDISIDSYAGLLGLGLLRSFLKVPAGTMLKCKELQDREKVRETLETALKRQAQLSRSLDFLDWAMHRKVGRAEMLQKKGAQPRVSSALKQEKKLSAYIEHWDTEVNEMPEVRIIVSESKHYSEQVRDLQRHEATLRAKAAELKSAALQKRKTAAEKRSQLQTLFHENIGLAAQVMHLEEEKARVKGERKPRTVYSRGFSVASPDRRTAPTASKIESLKRDSQELVNLQSSYFLRIRDLEMFFESCFDASHREFLRLQQLPRKDSGLRNSLYLETLQRNRPHPVPRVSQRPRSQAEILYDAVKTLVATAAKPAPVRGRGEAPPPRDFFAMVLMDPGAREMLHKQVFPTNTLCVRPSTTACSPRSQVSTSGTVSTSPRNRLNSPS